MNQPTDNNVRRALPGLWLVLIFALALGIRLYRINQPPLEFHQVRQYIGAIVARAYYFAHAPGVPEWRQQSAEFTKEHIGLLEPQIMPTLATAGYRLMGGEHLWIPRLISIGCWLVGGFLLWRLLTRLASPDAAVGALVFYLFMPFGIMASRVIQPDPMMIMFLLGTLLLILQYDEKPSLQNLAAATALLTAGMTVRPMCSVFAVPVFALLKMRRHGLVRSLFDWHSMVFAVLPVLPAAAYYLWTARQGEFIREHSSGAFLPHLLIQGFYWKGWLTMIGRTAGWLPCAVGLAATGLLAKGRFRALLLGLWGGYFVYGLIFNYHIYTHDYYSLPLIPIVACSLAALGSFSITSSAPGRGRHLAVGLIILLLSGGMAAAWVVQKQRTMVGVSKPWKSLLKESGALVGFDKKFLLFLGREDAVNRLQVEDFEKIGGVINHSHRTIYLTEDHGLALMYHGEFWGAEWPMSGVIRAAHRNGQKTWETTEDFKKLAQACQAEYFVVTELKDFADQTQVKEYITSKFSVFARGEHFLIFQMATNQPAFEN